MAETSFFSRFSTPAGDPLATEHEAISRYVEDALAHLGRTSSWQDLDPKKIPAGKALLEAKPDLGRRYLLAAVQQAVHWEGVMKGVHDQRKDMKTFVSDHNLPGWAEAYGPQHQTLQVIHAFLRRALPLVKGDILAILAWCNLSEQGGRTNYPPGLVARAVERFAAEHGVDHDLRPPLVAFAAALRNSYDQNVRRFGRTLDQLCAGKPEAEPASPPVARRATPRPAPVGNPRVLVAFKEKLGIPGADAGVAATLVGPDRFPLRADSPLAAEHASISAVFEEFVAGRLIHLNAEFGKLASARAILDVPPDGRGRLLLAALERRVGLVFLASRPPDGVAYASYGVLEALPVKPDHLSREELFDVLLCDTMFSRYESRSERFNSMVRRIEAEAAEAPLSEGERFVLHLWREALVAEPPLGALHPDIAKLTELIGDEAPLYLVPGEDWAGAVNAFVGASPKRAEWKALLLHALSATGARPSGKWLKTARERVKAVGEADVRESLADWFARMPGGRSIKLPKVREILHESNATCLRGLLWIVPLLPGREPLARLVAGVGVSAYRKIPESVFARSAKVGNAAVYALSEFGTVEAVGQLAMLKVRARSVPAQKEIEKAFVATAAALGLPRDQVEEMGVPSYGLEDVGRREETLGDHRAELVVTGSEAELRWFDEAGKRLKSVPAEVKKEHAEDLKELQQSLKDLKAILPAQRDRLDGLFLAQASWPVAAWRERYLDHPLVGTIARRLIWCVDGVPALFADGAATGVDGEPVAVADSAKITTWHPVGRTIEEITSWRRRLEALGITQPFKQAHREIYILTDAERGTGTYSNRFAAHILRQHQFNALCGARGWKNKLRLMVDASYGPPSRELPQWGLRAEFWVEGVGTTYGVDTNETGTYLRIATDQVRFYRLAAATSGAPPAELLPLEAVPPLVFSEIMRDVDLFVGVGSVGNDPTWLDGGPEGRFRAYWQSYSFGELSASAATRREVLERLVPRLKIASRCSFAERFLVVRGDKRTYKIHLGSGNILMEPNDQYLCIVADQRARTTGEEGLYLPFEGDAVLSVILSKAFLLAGDSKIKDPTILSQIERA